MRIWRRAAAVLCLVMVATGCVSGRGPASSNSDPLAGSDPVPRPEVKLPALPLWSPTGLTLTDGGPRGEMAYTYAPVTIQGVELQPVRIPGGVVYLRLQGSEVFLHGTHTPRGGYAPLAEPRLLHRLPLKAGDSWEIAYPGTIGATYTYRVEAVEQTAIPGGERPAARIQVERDKQPLRTEWWAPGYGLVQMQGGPDGAWTAAREQREAARDPEPVGRPAPGPKALLWDDGSSWKVTNLDGSKVIFEVEDSYWRSWYEWRKAGAQDLLFHSQNPGSFGVILYRALAYSPATGEFAPVSWISSAGEREAVSGTGTWSSDGAFRLNHFEGYPGRWYTYRFDGKSMRADPADDQEIRAESARALANRLASPPLLGEADFAAMFADPAEGRSAWSQLRAAGWSPVGGAAVTSLGGGGAAEEYQLESGQIRLRISVIKGERDYQFKGFQLVK